MTDAKPFDFVGVGISDFIVRSIFGGIRLVFQLRSRLLNTIPIDHQELPCCTMRMVRSVTFLPQSGLSVNDEVQSGVGAEVRPGNALPLVNIPLGTTIHNIELKPGKGGQLIRSAGGSAQVMGRDGAYVQIRLKSGEMRKVLSTCMATVGQVGNVDHENVVVGKAGRTRWKGKRPHVRGVVMNPVDHPHGGGEGKSGQGNPHPVSPWGTPAKGYKTRKNKATDKFIISRRKK